jgi:Sulfotransferase family
MKPKYNAPIFLVGCPRSGTTLLQSLLAAHPQIASFPESKFFHYILPEPEYEPRRLALGLISRRLRPRLEKYFRDELGRSDMLQQLPRIVFMSYYTHKFMNIMYLMTKEQGKSIFLEKTPDHIYKIEYIERFVPRSRFIHILRNGADVVASLYEVTKKYPDAWAGAKNIDMCIAEWTRAVKCSIEHIHKSNHILVKYEDLVENTSYILKKTCQFIGVEFDQKMLENYAFFGKNLSLDREGRSITNVIQNANSKKFYTVFDPDQRKYVLERLSEWNMDKIGMN